MFLNNSFRATSHTPPGGTIHFITCPKGTSLEHNHNVTSVYFARVLPLLYSWFILSSCHFKPSHWSPCYQPTLSTVTILMKIWSVVAYWWLKVTFFWSLSKLGPNPSPSFISYLTTHCCQLPTFLCINPAQSVMPVPANVRRGPSSLSCIQHSFLPPLVGQCHFCIPAVSSESSQVHRTFLAQLLTFCRRTSMCALAHFSS